jgi:hypothetical protein
MDLEADSRSEGKAGDEGQARRSNFVISSWHLQGGVMSSDCVSLGVPHRDRDVPQLCLSKSPVEPRSFALLAVLQLEDHSRRRRRSFCSRSMHGSSTDTRAPWCDLWAQSANYIGRTSILRKSGL